MGGAVPPGAPMVAIRRICSTWLLRCLCLLAALAGGGPVEAQTFQQTLVAGGLSSPTAMAFAPDGRLFVCEQSGRLRVIKNGVLLAKDFVTLAVTSNSERG